MTATELELQKAEIARMVLNETDDRVIGKIVAIFAQKKKAIQAVPPCQYTEEELHKQIDRSMADYRAGRVVTMEEMKAKRLSP